MRYPAWLSSGLSASIGRFCGTRHAHAPDSAVMGTTRETFEEATAGGYGITPRLLRSLRGVPIAEHVTMRLADSRVERPGQHGSHGALSFIRASRSSSARWPRG